MRSRWWSGESAPVGTARKSCATPRQSDTKVAERVPPNMATVREGRRGKGTQISEDASPLAFCGLGALGELVVAANALEADWQPHGCVVLGPAAHAASSGSGLVLPVWV